MERSERACSSLRSAPGALASHFHPIFPFCNRAQEATVRDREPLRRIAVLDCIRKESLSANRRSSSGLHSAAEGLLSACLKTPPQTKRQQAKVSGDEVIAFQR